MGPPTKTIVTGLNLPLSSSAGKIPSQHTSYCIVALHFVAVAKGRLLVRLHGAEAIAASQRARVCEGHLESMLLKKNSILVLIIC